MQLKRSTEAMHIPTSANRAQSCMCYMVCVVQQQEEDILMTGVVTPSALSKLTMLWTSSRLLAPLEVDLSLSLARISVFMLFA